MAKTIKLEGRVFIAFDVEATTGLHIGGTNANIEIGGVDKSVIRDVLTNQPYIPGSSFKGKMRSLLEKYKGLEQNQRIGQGYIHSCTDNSTYRECTVCQAFGVPGERDFGTPTRLVVRDIRMNGDAAELLEKSARTDLPYTEVKTEVSIDRVTSAANPRQMERVPAGTVFGPGEIVYSIYSGDECDALADVGRLRTVVEGLQLLEDDYLGGLGTRGSGRVQLQNIRISARSAGDYLGDPARLGEYPRLPHLVAALEEIQSALQSYLGLSEG